MKNGLGKISSIKNKKLFQIEIDLEWRERLIEKQKEQFVNQPNLIKLRDKLENIIEGTMYCPVHEVEEELNNILNKGVLFGKTSKIIKGRQSSCHENSCLLFLLQNPKYAKENGYKQKAKQPFEIGEIDIYTGYALSDDGVWRQHTWCAGKEGKYQNKPIETTISRLNYFGYRLEGDELLDLIDAYF